MAPKATQASLWLPGFDIDSPVYPDLFGATEEVTTAPSTFAGNAPSSATMHTATAPELPRPWHPTTIRAANAVAWPQWPSSALDNLEGQATKFCANLEAIAVLRVVEKDARAPTEDERAALQRFTGWGGIPASINLDGYDAPWSMNDLVLIQQGSNRSRRDSSARFITSTFPFLSQLRAPPPALRCPGSRCPWMRGRRLSPPPVREPTPAYSGPAAA